MNPIATHPSSSAKTRATRVAVRLLPSIAVALIGLGPIAGTANAQDRDTNGEDAEVLTRGPVHEAFAEVVDYNPSRGFLATKPPPDPIEEIPPDERPEGDDVAWIPGYWAWDDDHADYIWVSGVWRSPPPGREWIAGYWAQDGGEYLWISGYWAETDAQETTYLPPPPESLESGPNVTAPDVDYRWTPGCWVWYRGNYAWRPGYWARGRGDWVWMPAHYVWTPRGCIFVDGYWDYTVARRGILYAPVYFHSRAYARRGYVYSPSIVFNLGFFSDYLFVRPSYHHYYFGDYYDPRYEASGFYFSFSYQRDRRGYDPFYAHRRWENRRDRDWDRNFRASYTYRRDNVAARPPDSWSAQVATSRSTTTATRTRVVVAGTVADLSASKQVSMKFQRVNSEERQLLEQRGADVRRSRDDRRTVELRASGSGGARPGVITEPVTVKAPKSSIAARPENRLPWSKSAPKPQRSPKPDVNVKPAPGVDSHRQAPDHAARDPQSRMNPTSEPRPVRPTEAPSRDERASQQAAERAGNPQQEAQVGTGRRQAEQSTAKKEAATRARAKQEAAERANAAEAKAKSEAKRRAAEAKAPKGRESPKPDKSQSDKDDEDNGKNRKEKP